MDACCQEQFALFLLFLVIRHHKQFLALQKMNHLHFLNLSIIFEFFSIKKACAYDACFRNGGTSPLKNHKRVTDMCDPSKYKKDYVLLQYVSITLEGHTKYKIRFNNLLHSHFHYRDLLSYRFSIIIVFGKFKVNIFFKLFLNLTSICVKSIRK